MGTRILTGLLLIGACVGGYFVWMHYAQQRQANDTSVTCIGCMTPEDKARFDKENSGETVPVATTANAAPARSESTPVTAAAPAPAFGSGTNAVRPPASDSQNVNNPNSLRFSGSGNYQWYRQGDLTYRIDTVKGTSCVAYATMEEWRKQIVYSHGCGRGA